MMSILTRREFLKRSLLVGSAISLPAMNVYSAKSGNDKSQQNKYSSRVVIARNKLVRDANGSLNTPAIFSLLNSGLEIFYETYPAKKIWARLFSPEDRVGLKVNCLAGKGLSTSIELIDAIVENLVSVGVKKGNIIIWDRANRDLERAHYKIQTSSQNVKCYGNDYAGYTDQLYESRSIGSFLSNILVKQTTVIINVPILKDHGIVGMTNALKNFFGAIHNPNKYHSYWGDPFIADVNLLPEIRNKVRLTICDALTAQYEGGPPFMPQWSWHHNGLIVGTDMVAIDRIGWKIIEDQRAQHGFPSLKEAGREPTYIQTAADAEHRLGESDLNKIQLIEI